MAENTKLEQILTRENTLLDTVLGHQAELRKAVREKKWETLMDTVSSINACADEFKSMEAEREALYQSADAGSRKAVQPLLAAVRGKLVRSKSENGALDDYISITRGFIQGVLDQAVPQSRSTVYSRKGTIVHPQPSSVVVNTLY